MNYQHLITVYLTGLHSVGHTLGYVALNNDFTRGFISFPLVHYTLAIQCPQCKGPITDGIANSLVTRGPVCSDIDIPI